MRLTCPNCSAQYEVDDQVIPRNGRDVQCSACAHTWYQYPMDVTLQMKAADLDDDEEDDDGDGRAPATDGRGPAAPRIDKTVLNVLREEAERELQERKRGREALETQGELGLATPKRSRAGGVRYFGEEREAPEPPPVTPDVDGEDGEEGRAVPSRRNQLPDIEELSSTLEPAGIEAQPILPRPTDSDDGDEPSAFRKGMTLVLLTGAGLVILYVLAPLLVANIPALDGPLRLYVGSVDQARALLADTLRGLLGGG